MVDFFDSIFGLFENLMNYFDGIDSYFEAIFVWLQTWYLKMKLHVKLMFIRTSYLVAVNLLSDLGFNTLLSELFNALPSELRYWATLFSFREGFSLYLNCATTAFVMRISR